jgi:hypothetical protein
MKARLAILVLLVFAPLALAERVAQQKSEAKLVVVGKVKKITSTESKFFKDGIQTNYMAEVVVDKVDKGKDAKVGDTIKVHWYKVTKSPSKLVPAAYGHGYPIKEKDQARFWLLGGGKDGWTIIYNRDGVEKLKK